MTISLSAFGKFWFDLFGFADLVFDLKRDQVKHRYGTTSRAAPQVRSNHSHAMYHAAKSICRHKLNSSDHSHLLETQFEGMTDDTDHQITTVRQGTGLAITGLLSKVVNPLASS